MYVRSNRTLITPRKNRSEVSDMHLLPGARAMGQILSTPPANKLVTPLGSLAGRRGRWLLDERGRRHRAGLLRSASAGALQGRSRPLRLTAPASAQARRAIASLAGAPALHSERMLASPGHERPVAPRNAVPLLRPLRAPRREGKLLDSIIFLCTYAMLLISNRCLTHTG